MHLFRQKKIFINDASNKNLLHQNSNTQKNFYDKIFLIYGTLYIRQVTGIDSWLKYTTDIPQK